MACCNLLAAVGGSVAIAVDATDEDKHYTRKNRNGEQSMGTSENGRWGRQGWRAGDKMSESMQQTRQVEENGC